MMLVCICADRAGLHHVEAVERLQEQLLQAMHSVLANSHPADTCLPARLLLSTALLRELSVEHKRMMSSLRSKPEFSQDIHLETFGIIE